MRGSVVGSNEKYEAALRVPSSVSAALRVHLAKMVQALQTTGSITVDEACDHIKLQVDIVQQHHVKRKRIIEEDEKEARKNGQAG